MGSPDDELLRAIQDWADDERSGQAKSERVERRWQQQLATEEMRFSGLLIDLLEQPIEPQIVTTGNRLVAGRVSALGADFVAITAEERPTVMVAISAVASVQLPGDFQNVGAASDRELTDYSQTLGDVLANLTADQVRVRLVLKHSERAREGMLVAVGHDVAAVVSNGEPALTTFIPLDQISEVSAI